MAGERRIRRRLRVKLPVDPMQLGAGGLWVGLAGSRVAQEVAAAEQSVCHAHRDRPHLGELHLSQGSWWVDVETCCEDLMAHVEKKLGTNQN